MRMIAPKRSSVAGSTPPISMSATSVVVRSMTPAIMPESTSFSIERPPTPVAWNTRHSNSSRSAALMRCTAGVVTPNIVSPTAGRRRVGRGLPPSRRAFAMPISACAPLASTWREIELRPETSVTEYIIVMSEGPT